MTGLEGDKRERENVERERRSETMTSVAGQVSVRLEIPSHCLTSRVPKRGDGIRGSEQVKREEMAVCGKSRSIPQSAKI